MKARKNRIGFVAAMICVSLATVLVHPRIQVPLMSKITQSAAPSSIASAAHSAKTHSAASTDSKRTFTRSTKVQPDAMKRSAPDDFHTPAAQRNRSNGPFPEIQNMRVVYDPRTTPWNNPFHDPSLDQYLGLNQANPRYEPTLDQYLGL